MFVVDALSVEGQILYNTRVFGLEELSVSHFVQESLVTGLLVQVILNSVIFKSFVGGCLQIVSQWLQRRLEVVAIGHFSPLIFIHFVVHAEQIRHVAVVFVQNVVSVFRLQKETRLNFHELLTYLLVSFRQHRVSFWVGKERIRRNLDPKHFLAEKAIQNGF